MISPALRYAKPFNLLPSVPAGSVLCTGRQDDAYSATIRDRSGKGNHGTIVNALWTRLSNGFLTPIFDGDDYVSFGTPASITALTQGAVEAWVYIDTLVDGGRIFGYGGAKPTSSSGSCDLRLTLSTNYYFGFQQASDDWAAETASNYRGNTVLSAGKWYHVVWISDGSTWTLWVGTLTTPPVLQSLTSIYGTAGNNGDWFGDTTLTATKDLSMGAVLNNGAYANFLIGKIPLLNLLPTAPAATYPLQSWQKTRHLIGA